MTNKLNLSFAILSLIIGLLIYLCFRQSTFIHSFFSFLLNLEGFAVDSIKLSNWFLYNLPDLLWSYSLTTTIFLLWEFDFSGSGIYWLFIPLFVTSFYEIGQNFNIVPGTYDLKDIIYQFYGYVFVSFP